jgi:hypothetical protein
MLQLNAENYHSPAANMAYMSVSQYKKFVYGCEAAALAEAKGEYTPPPKPAFLEGSYVHAWAAGELDKFKAEHPEIISSRGPTIGQLKSDFKKCDEMIEAIKRHPFAMMMLEGEKETVVTAEMFGIPWKARLDCRNPKWITDLKTAESLKKAYWRWSEEENRNIKIPFYEEFYYPLQIAVYQELDRLAAGREKGLPPYIVAVTKQDPPDVEVLNFHDEARLAKELADVKERAPRIVAIKKGEIEPVRCEDCAYCRQTKQITRSRYYTELKPA